MVTLEEAKRGSVRTVTVRHGDRAPRSHQVKIPAGVTEGQRLRIAGRGEPGSGGGAAGDFICASGSPGTPTLKWTAQFDLRSRTRAVGSRAGRGNFRADARRAGLTSKSPPARRAARNSACADAACRRPAICSSSPKSSCRRKFPKPRKNCGNNSSANPNSIRVIELGFYVARLNSRLCNDFHLLSLLTVVNFRFAVVAPAVLVGRVCHNTKNATVSNGGLQ